MHLIESPLKRGNKCQGSEEVWVLIVRTQAYDHFQQKSCRLNFLNGFQCYTDPDNRLKHDLCAEQDSMADHVCPMETQPLPGLCPKQAAYRSSTDRKQRPSKIWVGLNSFGLTVRLWKFRKEKLRNILKERWKSRLQCRTPLMPLRCRGRKTWTTLCAY